MQVFRSQNGEDIYVYNNYLNKYRSDGVFVELGAMDGLTYSNTYFFERELGYDGVLIEPTNQYERLVINRPVCKNVNLAVNYNDTSSIFIGNGPCGGLLSSMNDNFKSRNNVNSMDKYYVKCSPFKKILNDNNVKYIDLLSIDVEGGEQIVLETMDFNIPVFVIIIELDEHNPEKDDKCRDILRKQGFTFDIRVNINEFWINKNYFRKELLYDKNKTKINFSNIHKYAEIPHIDMYHPNIHEVRDSLLLDHSIV
jgi:FkbM family methyltransferase